MTPRNDSKGCRPSSSRCGRRSPEAPDGYDAFIAGDMEWMNEHLHENIVWHVPGNNVLSGDYTGRENVLAFLAKSVQIVLPEFDFHGIIASDDHVVALLNITWRRNVTRAHHEHPLSARAHQGSPLATIRAMATESTRSDFP
jgi:ketosteroid isomerase-like protein